MKRLILLSLTALMLAGCGEFSQLRYDGLTQLKRNHAEDVERAADGKLTAVELRSSMESYDKSLLDEEALKGNDADLEKLRQQLEGDSDQIVKNQFNGDNGRDN